MSDRLLEEELALRLRELFGPRAKVKFRRSASGRPTEATVLAEGRCFVVGLRQSRGVAETAMAIRQLRASLGRFRQKAAPLLVVPYMGEAGRQLCLQEKMAWLDLSGNASIIGPGLRIEISGRPNRFKHPGRLRSLFAPKASRIARWFLMHPTRTISQRGLARSTHMDEGFTSRIVRQLERQDLLVRNRHGQVRVADPNLMLDAWREEYDFFKHTLIRGHVAGRSGEDTMRRIVKALSKDGAPYAATGLAGAWLRSHFAEFRIVTLFLERPPRQQTLDALGFRPSPAPNVWLVLPNDTGVFEDSTLVEGVRTVHPLQIYLDLKNHPERSKEAAEEIRKSHLRWRRDGRKA